MGGIQRYLDTLFKELEKRKVSVHFISPSYDKDEIEKIGNLTIHKLKIMNTRVRDKNQAAKKLYKYLKNLVKKEKIDIISAESFYRGAPPSYIFAVNMVSMGTKVPVVLRMHSHFTSNLQKSFVKDLYQL